MTMTDAVEKLEHVDDLFGEISTHLVHICEEMPSLKVPKDVEEKIVGFCCTFLERLVKEDKSVQRILSSVRGNVDRVPSTHCSAPEGARQAIERTTSELQENQRSMDTLVCDFRTTAADKPYFPLLNALLSESETGILEAIKGIRAELGSLAEGWNEGVPNRQIP